MADNYWKTVDGKPVFRIVWSDDQLEKRIGQFHDFYGEIYVRTFNGLREVRKYPGPEYRERWVLEKFIPMNNPEVWESLAQGGVYEPIWVFRGPNGTYQKPTWKAVQFLIGMLLGEKKKMSQSDIDDQEETLLADEINQNFQELNNRPSFADDTYIVVPRNHIGRS